MTLKPLWILILIMCLFPNIVKSQAITISGYVQDSLTGEKLIGANILDEASHRGTSTNQFGFFSIAVAAGNQGRLLVSYVGYGVDCLVIASIRDTLVVIRLGQNTEINAVTIIGKPLENRKMARSFGMVTLDASSVSKLPTLTGIRDVLRSSQLLPGIQGGKEGSSQIYIRGEFRSEPDIAR